MNISWKSRIALVIVIAIGFGTGLVMQGWLGTSLVPAGTGLLAGSAAALVAMLSGCFSATQRN